jgi:hypothetical protein
MTFIVAQDETTMKVTGTTTFVPNRDVNKLSYYLQCGTVSCGVDIIKDDLLDYQNVHKLSSDRQDAIFMLAYDAFDLDTLVNKTIFLDDDNDILPRNATNKFCKLERVQTCLAVQESVMIAGQETEVHQIMVCDRRWIKNYYTEPIQRNMSRIRRIMAGNKPEEPPRSAVDDIALAIARLLIGNDLEVQYASSHMTKYSTSMD